MTNNQFEIGTMKFKMRKIPALKQVHILRKILPVFGNTNPENIDKNNQSFADMFIGISNLPDETFNFVFFGLLSSVEVQVSQNTGWAPLADETRIRFENLEVPELFQIAFKAFEYNFSNFSSALRAQLQGDQKAQ